MVAATDDSDGLGLADAISQLREDLLRARRSGADADIQLLVESLTVELTVVAVKGKDGRAGFTVPVVNAELDGGANRTNEVTQTVTVHFGGPVDRQGGDVPVTHAREI